MEKEKRKLVYKEGYYQLLKINENSKWHNYGKRISLKSLYDIIKSEKYNIEISKDVLIDLGEYRKKRNMRLRKHKDLSTKVI